MSGHREFVGFECTSFHHWVKIRVLLIGVYRLDFISSVVNSVKFRVLVLNNVRI